jgi:Cu-Zn family superoxide dismutase
MLVLFGMAVGASPRYAAVGQTINRGDTQMKMSLRIAVAFVVPALVAGAFLSGSSAFAQSPTQGARAEIKDAQGNMVGTAVFSPATSGVKLDVQMQGFATAAAGEHGIHVHAVGKCEPDAFTTAGGHFNPTGKKHGLNSAEGAHAGDMPNLMLDGQGNSTYGTTLAGISLGSDAGSLFDADGSAVVIHAGPDDLVTDPAGNSGARVACGVVSAYAIPVAGMPSTGGPEDWSFVMWTVLFVALALGVAGRSVSARAGR